MLLRMQDEMEQHSPPVSIVLLSLLQVDNYHQLFVFSLFRLFVKIDFSSEMGLDCLINLLELSMKDDLESI